MFQISFALCFWIVIILNPFSLWFGLLILLYFYRLFSIKLIKAYFKLFFSSFHWKLKSVSYWKNPVGRCEQHTVCGLQLTELRHFLLHVYPSQKCMQWLQTQTHKRTSCRHRRIDRQTNGQTESLTFIHLIHERM